MAQIPLAQIPNAPDLASMARPQTNDVNVPMVDFGSERAAVASAYRNAEQNPNSAGLIGKAISNIGGQVADVANKYAEKQQKLQNTAALAQMDGLSKTTMDDINGSLDQSQPHTWAGQFADKYKAVDDWYNSQPVSVQQAIYPQYIHDRYMNQASIGIAAHKTQITNETNTAVSQIQQAQNSWDYGTAYKLADGLMSSGAIGVAQKNELYSGIEASKITNAISFDIQQDPKVAYAKIDAALNGDYSLQNEYMKGLSPKELSNFQKIADNVSTYRDTQVGSALYDQINGGGIKTLEQLQATQIFQTASPKWQQAAKDKLLNEVISGTPEGAKAYGDALGKIVAFRSGNPQDMNKDYADLVLTAGSLPKKESAEVLKAAQAIYTQRLENGGSLPYDVQVRNSMTAMLHRQYRDGAFGDPSSNEAITKFKQAEADWQKIQAENPHSYSEAEAKYWQTHKDSAARAILLKGQQEQKPSWLTHPIERWNYKPQSSASPASNAEGKVTEYYPSEGYGAATKGAFNDNKLDNESLAVSPDIQQKFKEQGIKPFDKVKLTLADGREVIRRYDDHTATDEEAKKQGLPPLRGRYDFRVPKKGSSGFDGVKVAKVERYTEDGRG